MSELETGFRLGEVMAMIRRQFLVVGASFLVGIIVGYVLFASAPTKYSATARVEVGPDPMATTANGSPVPPSMETEKDLVKLSDAVANAVRQQLKLAVDNKTIRGNITVALTDKSTVMQITYVATSADEARRAADAVAQAYLDNRRLTITQARDNQVSALTGTLNALKATANAKRVAAAATKPGTAAGVQAAADLAQAASAVTVAQGKLDSSTAIDPTTSGRFTTHASLPAAVTSKKALAEGAGAFGIVVVLGILLAWMLDRRRTLGSDRRRIELLLPTASMRVMPGAEGPPGSPAEHDTAIDRLAVELVAGATGGRARSVLVIGAGDEPPVSLGEELASSLAFAGIPTLFVLAGTSDRELRHAQVVGSFADLLQGPSVTGQASLPERAGAAATTAAPTVSWLRPRGSAESSGLLRRVVVEALVSRAGRERFEAVVFVAAAPSRTAAGTALGQWVDRTALVVDRKDRSRAEDAATALIGADVAVTEVVWT